MADEIINSDRLQTQESKELARFAKEQAVMTLPAILIDEFSMVYWKDHIRLAMGETSKRTGTHWRFAALMETKDVRELIERLQDLLREMDEDAAKAAANAAQVTQPTK